MTVVVQLRTVGLQVEDDNQAAAIVNTCFVPGAPYHLRGSTRRFSCCMTKQPWHDARTFSHIYMMPSVPLFIS